MNAVPPKGRLSNSVWSTDVPFLSFNKTIRKWKGGRYWTSLINPPNKMLHSDTTNTVSSILYRKPTGVFQNNTIPHHNRWRATTLHQLWCGIICGIISLKQLCYKYVLLQEPSSRQLYIPLAKLPATSKLIIFMQNLMTYNSNHFYVASSDQLSMPWSTMSTVRQAIISTHTHKS